MFLLRALFLWISLFGCCSFFKKQLHPSFAPLVTLSSIGTLLFLAGFLNIMKICVWLIVFTGWALLLVQKPWEKRFWADNKSIFVTFTVFSVICCLFLFRVYKRVPVHYDNFSHWLTVIREMINTDSMPNFKSTLISFQGYPTGSAGFVYFICKVLGNSRDDLVLFAQSILYAASLTVFTAFIKRRDVFGVLVAIAGSLFCMTAHSLALEYLLVDTLISLISVGVVAIVVYYRHDLWNGVLLSLPLQLFLVAIKNSGILMVAINFCLVIALAIASDYTAKRKLHIVNLVKLGGITAGAPAALYYLWTRHVDYVFLAGSTTKHSASLENYIKIFTSKTETQIKEILTVFFNKFTSWNKTWLLLIIVCAIILIGWLIKTYFLKQRSKAEFFILLGVVGAYLVFMMILAAMYLLSMPYHEAIILAAYDRYEKTILVYIIGAVTLYILSLTSLIPLSKKGIPVKLLLVLLCSSTLLFQTASIKSLVLKPTTYANPSRIDFEQIKNEYTVEEGKRYFIYCDRFQKDGGYHAFLSRYVFWSKDIFLCSPEDFNKHKGAISNYDYLIILDYDDQINTFLSDHNVETQKQAYAVKGVF